MPAALGQRRAWSGLIATFASRIALAVPASSGPLPANEIIITGGAESQRDDYTWMVTNRTSSAIVRVEFPNHHGLFLSTPPGWSTENAIDKPVRFGGAAKRWIAQAGDSVPGIQPGTSAVFRMRVSRSGTRPQKGAVLVRLADGREGEISGVELPFPEGVGDKYITLIGLGAIFVIFVALRRRKRTKREIAS